MINQAGLSSISNNAERVIQKASNSGWMTEEEHDRIKADLSELGFKVFIETNAIDEHADDAVTDEHGRTFFEVSIHPIVQQVADENGKPLDGDWFNPSGSEFSEEFGDELDDYPEAMFRKGWSVSSWVREDDDDEDGDIDVVDDEEFPDYEAAIIRAEELATKYRVEIDHRY